MCGMYILPYLFSILSERSVNQNEIFVEAN